jgi:hypothetical protein
VDLTLVVAVCWSLWLLMVASVAAIRAGDAGGSIAYYVDQVSCDRHDYYAGHGEAPGMWRGCFAEHLGLSGHVNATDFRAVLEGHDPSSGEPLKPRANRRGRGVGRHVLTAEVDLDAVGPRPRRRSRAGAPGAGRGG